MDRPIRWYDYITINIYFMGLTVISQTMTPLVVPLLVQQFVGVGQQATFYGTARLWSLMVALLVQALMGMLSDRSTLHWGRRRPFIFIGTMGNLVFISLIGFSAGLEGWTGYWFLFTMLILLSVTSNTAQGAVQALIPDLVPEDQRGLFSGVKALFEVPFPVIFVSFVIGRLISAGHMWAGLIAAMGLLTLTMLISMLISEKPLQETLTPLDWQPFLRLVLMTGLFTLIILGVREILIFIGHLLEETSSTSLLFVVMGVVGLAAMVLAVGLGVYFSVYLSVGNAERQNSSYTWWVINRLAYLVGSTNLASFAVFFLQGRLGLVREKAAGPASQLILIVGIFILLTAVPSGWLADRFGR
jgi:MFS family permease